MWNQLTLFIQEQLQNNDLFKGGLLLMVGGAALALFRSWPGYFWDFIKRQSMIVIDIPDKDKAFDWVNHWLAEHAYSKNKARLLTVKTERHDRRYDTPTIVFSPAPGMHYLWYKRRLMILSRQRRDQPQGNSDSNGNSNPFREYFTIRILGRNREIAFSLIQEAYKLCHPHTVDKITVHRAKYYGDWTLSTGMPMRPLSSIILPNGVTEHIVDDLQTFLDSEKWYAKRGIPYRRGYLLYGPPGNGKTSAITALASHFKFDIGLLNLKAVDMSDDDLADSMSNVPPHTIIVLEDVDCITKGREIEDTKVSFSGLLNALDGLGAAHGQIVFMTTNFRSKLDGALIRPGRCDVQIELPNANLDQKSHMFERFFPDSNLSRDFSNRASNDISMATLQNHLMQHRNDPQLALDFADQIAKDI